MTRTHKICSLPAAHALMALGAMTGCVAEDLSNCPPTVAATVYEEVLVVRVDDIISGEDITAQGRVVDASLMVFDSAGGFARRVELAGSEVGREIEIPIPASATRAGEPFYISAWGNIAGNIDIQGEVAPGDDMSNQFLYLKESENHAGNKLCPGEMFFGLKRVTPGTGDIRTTRADTVKIVHLMPITQRTARLAVTVRGLPAGATDDQYYFSLCEQNDGFTFLGDPVQNDAMCKIREQGVFNSRHEYVSPQPYNLIPSLHPEDEAGCKAGVCLYQVGTAAAKTRNHDSADAGYVNEEGDVNLSGKATVDVDGNHIAFYAGQTTNVLMTFGPTGTVEVRVEYTPWGEVHQWTTW